MLQLRSFKFGDQEQMNELLRANRLAQGASVFVSNGEIIIPIEDGEAKNTAQLIIDVKEQKNTVIDQTLIIQHSQKVLNFLLRDANVRLDEAKANNEASKNEKGKKKYDKEKETEALVKNAEATVKDLEGQIRMNDHELLRLNLNCELFDKQIAEYEKQG